MTEQEFHISITPVRDNEYLVRTEQVEPGVPLAEEQVIWPVEQWLAQTRQLMNDPLEELLQGQGGIPNTDTNAASLNQFMALGQQLYQSLFQGILRDSWMTAQGIAHHRRDVLRLRLGLKGTQLPKLPWEVMHSHSRDGLGLATHPIATGTDLLFSRYQCDRHISRAIALKPPTSSVVKILMVIALPADQDQLNLNQEAHHLKEELRLQPGHLRGNLIGTLPDIQVTILAQPSRAQLAHALEQSQYQVLHYAGHSDLGVDGGKLYLVDQNGLTETLAGDDLAGLLGNNGIKLAVFNSCRGGHTATAHPPGQSQRTLTDALVSRGIPAVLAMAERIPDDVALTLTRLFYRNLKQGYPIDLSLSRARQGLLSAYGSNQLYWALPTLYLHPDFDGRLTLGDSRLHRPGDAFAGMPQAYTPTLADTVQLSASAPLPQPTAYGKAEAIASDDRPDAVTDMMPGVGFADQANMNRANMNRANMNRANMNRANMNQDHQVEFDLDDSGDIYNDFEELTPNDDADDAENVLMSPADMAELMDPAEAPSEEDVTVVSDILHQVRQEQPPQSSAELGAELGAESGAIKTGSRQTAAIVHQSQADQSQARAAHPTGGSLAPVSSQSQRSPSAGTLQPVGPAAHISPVTSPPRPRQPVWYPLAGAAAALVLMFVGYRASQDIFQPSSTQKQIATSEIIPRVEQTLAEQDLEEARDLLDQVPKEDIDEPKVAFLQGQWVWEKLKTGNNEYDLEDVRSYWEHAAHGTKEKPAYYNALGFALYAEGKANEAVKAWTTALEILESQGFEVEMTSEATQPELEQYAIAMPSATISNTDALTAYAGTVLALAQIAVDSPTPGVVFNKAIEIQQVVLASDPATFEPEALGRNWLWTEAAVTEWAILSQTKLQ